LRPGVLAAAALLGGLLLAGCGGKKPVATINGIPISEEEFGDRCANLVQEQPTNRVVALSVLGNLLTLKVMEKEVRRLNLIPTDADVDRRFETVKRQFEFIQPPLEQRLRVQGRSEAAFKRDLQDSLIEEAFRLHDIKVTDAEARQYYDTHLQAPEWSVKERVKISQIVLTTPEDLKKVQGELRGGASFATLARSMSKDPNTAPLGGALPQWFTRDDLQSTNLPTAQPALLKAFEMQRQTVSEPIQIGLDPRDPKKSAWILVQLDDKKPAASMPFDQVKDLVIRRVKLERSQPKQTETAREFVKLMKEAEIDVNRPEWQDFIRTFRQMMEARSGAGGPAGPPGMGP
jgi:hypothetical protein